jgi:hypothetical protein
VVGTLTTKLLGAGGVEATGASPGLDPATGMFSGPIAPTDGLDLGLSAFVPQLLTDGSVTVTIDSVLPGAAAVFGDAGGGPSYYVTVKGAGAAVKLVLPITQDGTSSDGSVSTTFQATTLDSAQSVRFGGDNSYPVAATATLSVPGTWRLVGWGRGDANGDPANSKENGPRWWAGAANETVAKPNSLICDLTAFTCAPSDYSLSAGGIAGVSIWRPSAYITTPTQPQRNLETILSSVARAADMKVYWGSGGKVDSVIDVTHHVPVPFNAKIRASWGLLTDASFAAVPQANTRDNNNALLTWTDVYCVDPIPALLTTRAASERCGGAGQPTAPLQNTATLSPIAIKTSSFAGSNALTTTGNGFIFYINGYFNLMSMASLPASGTVWNVRFYSGSITGVGSGYSLVAAPRPPAVPGLTIAVQYTGSKLNIAATDTTLLAKVHTVPDPYYATDALEISPNRKVLKFVNLPGQCIVRIYSLSGVLIQVLTHNDPQGGGELTWDLRNRNSQFVASGVYFYHVETADGKQKTGRFTVVNFAQ